MASAPAVAAASSAWTRNQIEVREQAAQPLMAFAGFPGILADRIAGRVEGGDAEQGEDQAPALGRCLAGEGGQLLLLGEHRGPEGGIVHAEHLVDVPAGVAHPFGHQEVIAVGLGLGRWR